MPMQEEQEVLEAQMRDSEIDLKHIDPTDPDEFCMNCGAKIVSIYRTCPFCGKVWYINEHKD